MLSALRTTSCLIVLSLWIVVAAKAQPPSGPTGPLEPSVALQHFQLDDGLRMELVASEPEVVDPIAIRFDHRGRMWVVEMRDYPNGPPEGQPPLSKIKRLEDRDQDGRFEVATVFAENLLFPTGLQPWKKGCIVTLAGCVAYFEDADDDGRADRRTDWYTGFMEENPQLRANHPTLGLDYHIYIANGLRGGTIREVELPDAPAISISGRDFRFHAGTHECEAISGVGQFGLTFDDFGRRFVCSNRNPLQHVVLEDRYLRMNPAIPISAVMQDVAAAAEQSKLFPLSRAWTTSNLHANQFTAACGVRIYRGDALPQQYYGNAFTCDPTGNLVHRECLEIDGATFRSRPAQLGREFLATTDEWFRPVNLEVGPDGALYVVDMYRAVIEHPDFVPDELKKRPDERFGDDRGRIYRIFSPAKPQRLTNRPLPNTTKALVNQLRSTNSWHRETSARLLLESGDTTAIAPLRQLIQESDSVVARIHALWLLEGLGAVTPMDMAVSMRNSDPREREQAFIIAEYLAASNDVLKSLLLAEFDHPTSDARSCFQAALSLGVASLEGGDLECGHHLTRVALRFPDDPWLRKAIALASGREAPAIAANVLRTIRKTRSGENQPENNIKIENKRLDAEQSAILCYELFHAAGLVEPWNAELFEAAVAKATEENDSRAALNGLITAWNARQIAWHPSVQSEPALAQSFSDVLASVRPMAMDQDASAESRRLAIELLRYEPDRATLRELALRDDDQQAIRILAIRAVAGLEDQSFWVELLARFPGASPAVRTAIVNAALDGVPSMAWLLDELESGRIKPQEIGRTEVERLQRLPTPELQQRAAKILEALTPEDRQQALARYAECLSLEADPRRGQEIFTRSCATCHRVGHIGVDVAPDISDSRTKTLEQLLGDVIQPNRAIDGNYINYVVQTSDGRTFTGIIAAETATSITLRQPENKSITLTRDEVEVIQSTGLSLMPEGLEQNLSLQDMADLLSYIKNWRYLDGQIPIEP